MAGVAEASWIRLAILAGALATGSDARGDIPLLSTSDGWELYTRGRIGAFLSYGRGDALPIAQLPEVIPLGGGLNPGSNEIPRLDAAGMPIATAQGTFESMRLRGGVDPNQLGIGLRRRLNDDTSVEAYVALWATIETEAQLKTARVFGDAREGYGEVKSRRWGTLRAGKALELFSRGAYENDVLLHDGYALGFPIEIDTAAPSGGMIGFGVLVAFFAAGFTYTTPNLNGLQLSLGLYDPTTIPAYYERTRYLRPEAELTYDLEAASLRLHLFANWATQAFYAPPDRSVTAYGVGYGGRAQWGPARVGFAGHWGRGLGLQFAFEPIDLGVARDDELRFFDGYSVMGQYALGPVDFNAAWGLSRVLALPVDSAKDATFSLPSQQALSFGIVYHATSALHLDVDYFHAWVKWSLGQSQVMDFINTGVTVTW
jgi:hypothetical protein